MAELLTEHPSNAAIQQSMLNEVNSFETMLSTSTSTSNIADLERLYLTFMGQLDAETRNIPEAISDHKLFETYRGQQLHMSNQLLIMIARQTKLYYDSFQGLSKRHNSPILFQ